MVTVIAKALIVGVEAVALAFVSIAFLILPEAATPFLAILAVPLVFLFVFTLFDALFR